MNLSAWGHLFSLFTLFGNAYGESLKAKYRMRLVQFFETADLLVR